MYVIVFQNCLNYVQRINPPLNFTPSISLFLLKVVGLTASLGVGKANSELMAQKYIQKMMANLDAEELSTVNKCLPELTEHVIVAEQGTFFSFYAATKLTKTSI